MEFLLGLFIGATWYYTALLIGLCVLFIGSALAESGWSVFLVATWFATLFYLGKIDVHHISYVDTLLLMMAYIAIGVIWSGYKWFLYVKEQKTEHDEKKRPYMFEVPKSSSKVEEISVWILFWWLSMLSYVFSDMVTDLVKRLGGFYNKIAEYALK